MSRSCWLVALVAILGALAASTAAAPAATCTPTLGDAAGPFGRGLPPQRAKIGTGHVLTGLVLSALDCRPLVGATVELWQAGKNGRYTRAGSGMVKTDRSGRFRFQGPYPPSYEGRPGHIHLRITGRGHEQLLARYVPAQGARRGSLRLVLEPAAV
jgi:protocatechuate 3,4-dioxygenase beta subunit